MKSEPSPNAPKPRSPRSTVDWRPSLVFKLDRDAFRGRDGEESVPDLRQWFGEVLPGLKVEPVFDPKRPRADRVDQDGLEGMSVDTGADLYFYAELPPIEEVGEIAEALGSWGGVSEAYIEPAPARPPSTDLRGRQRYLGRPGHGTGLQVVDAKRRGRGVTVADVERGWVTKHPDFPSRRVSLSSGRNVDFKQHGTRALGTLFASDNADGGVGAAPGISKVLLASQWRSARRYSTAAAIQGATSKLEAGDVIMVQAQANLGSWVHIPVLFEPAVRAAIHEATLKGITVVVAAGNGAAKLDDICFHGYGHLLRADSFRKYDCGAILVGASESGLDPNGNYSRLQESCYGPAVDLFCWGADVVTTDTTLDESEGLGHTEFFGGTSAAVAVVAGVVATLQGLAREAGLAPISPLNLRRVLKRTGSDSAPGQEIGVMPNLGAAMEALKLKAG